MKGGELFDRIVDKGHFTEADAAGVTAKLFSAIKWACRPSPGCQSTAHAVRHRQTATHRYLHDKNIAHRDLKPENLLMADDGPDSEVKITDFGLSKAFDEHSQVMQTPCGTPGARRALAPSRSPALPPSRPRTGAPAQAAHGANTMTCTLA